MLQRCPAGHGFYRPAGGHATQWGNWHISPAWQSQWLMFWGLALAAAGNAVAALG